MPNLVLKDGTELCLLGPLSELQPVFQPHFWLSKISLVVLLLLGDQRCQPCCSVDLITCPLGLVDLLVDVDEASLAKGNMVIPSQPSELMLVASAEIDFNSGLPMLADLVLLQWADRYWHALQSLTVKGKCRRRSKHIMSNQKSMFETPKILSLAKLKFIELGVIGPSTRQPWLHTIWVWLVLQVEDVNAN